MVAKLRILTSSEPVFLTVALRARSAMDCTLASLAVTETTRPDSLFMGEARAPAARARKARGAKIIVNEEVLGL